MTSAFSPAVDRALVLAASAHQGHERKGTSIPYITHPVHVAFILQRHGWPEHVVVAGLLHDVLEDAKCEDRNVRARLRSVFPGVAGAPDAADGFREALDAAIGREFGEVVLALVDGMSERKTENGVVRPWRDRKLELLEHLKAGGRELAAVKAADLLHNMRTIAIALAAHGAAVMGRFKAPPDQQIWWYGSAAAMACEKLGPDDALAAEVKSAFEEFERAVRIRRQA